MPVFAVSIGGIAAGVVMGILTVVIAAQSPAKRAAKVSPMAAVSGNAGETQNVKHALHTGALKVDTTLGINHAIRSKKNFSLMVGSFAFSIVLFLAFSALITFMNDAITPLKPYTPDLSIVCEDGSCSIDKSIAEQITGMNGVKRVYGRSFAYDIPAKFGETDKKVTLICSEELFSKLTGSNKYTIIDIQMNNSATDADISAIRTLSEGYLFSDNRLSNKETKSAFYSFALFVYGFLIIIAMIAVFNIMNSISMSVSSRIKQYGAMRAVGMSIKQLTKMITAEAVIYAVCGCIVGCALGLPIHKFLYDKLITSHWGDVWAVPFSAIAVIVALIFLTTIAAVHAPSKRIKSMAITDTINEL